MITSSEKCSKKLKNTQRNWFSTRFGILFCCVSKNKSQLKPRVVSSSVQCDIPFNSIEPDSSLKDEFKLSLNKLDSLINTLQDIKEKYGENNAATGDNIKIGTPTLSKTSEQDNEEITKFNVNINKQTCIECITKRGKHSLTIFDNNSNVTSECDAKSILFLKKCDSEMISTKSANTADEMTLANVVQLEKNYHTLSNNFGRFSSVISRHISTLRKDVGFLRSMMCNIDECKMGKKMIISQMSMTGVNRKDKSLVKSEEFKFVQAKLRASTFCRFYNMRHNQNIGKKRKCDDKHLKNKYTVSSKHK